MAITNDFFLEFASKMRAAGVSEAATQAFKHNYENLIAGGTGLIAEPDIEPVAELPRWEHLKASTDSGLLAQTLVLKLNGGLGTSMGLERAKSLLPVKDGLTFLDLIARQILHLRKAHDTALRFMLMNSFSTSRDTLEFLRKYPQLEGGHPLELMQSQAPKVEARTLRPVSWPENPQLEWCPPGHGDLYPSLLGSGTLAALLAEGVKILFASNADNLGASLDLALLNYFAESGSPFLMEVAERTASDRKGGHLARRGGKLVLRESAQCPPTDLAAFQDIQRHRFFNTNSLWVRLDHLKMLLDGHGGFIPLPMIKNAKTVDPRNKNSPAVFQLETAMGAAIECFENASAVVVPRGRFAPVKTTADLLALRSDAYRLTEDWRVVLAGPAAPAIDLEPSHYQLVDQLDEKLADGVPSLKDCTELTVRGPIRFNSKVVLAGKVTLTNTSSESRRLPPGVYRDRSVSV